MNNVSISQYRNDCPAVRAKDDSIFKYIKGYLEGLALNLFFFLNLEMNFDLDGG